jgi:hypothetical protein
MKKQFLYVTICVEVESKLEPPHIIQEIKTQAFFLISNTQHVGFLHAEVLQIESFNPFNN